MKRLSSIVLSLTSSITLAADWPQWMGPNRDDVWSEMGIVREFPAEGLKPRWRKTVHGGFAGPAVANGRVFVTDYLRLAGDAKLNPTKRDSLEGKELTPEKYVEQSCVHLLDPVGKALGRPIVWCHPPYANCGVFARNDQEIVCVSLAAEK